MNGKLKAKLSRWVISLRRAAFGDRESGVARRLTQAEYMALFEGETEKGSPKMVEAFKQALDARKFEIELYWKRATYFWTFIGAAFVGYAAFMNATPHRHGFAALLMSEVGLVFSYAWFMVNRGSKAWQENWENHVQLLEDKIAGPIYKLAASRPKRKSRDEALLERLVTSPKEYSVSKINAIVSLHVVLVWVVLLIAAGASLWIDDFQSGLHAFVLSHLTAVRVLAIGFVVLAAALTVLVLQTQAKTHTGGHNPIVRIRTTVVQDKYHDDGED